jgi:hypothetical protein
MTLASHHSTNHVIKGHMRGLCAFVNELILGIASLEPVLAPESTFSTMELGSDSRSRLFPVQRPLLSDLPGRGALKALRSLGIMNALVLNDWSQANPDAVSHHSRVNR